MNQLNKNQYFGVEELSNLNLNLSPIGNCGYSALIDRKGSIVWSCFPRFDGDPIFCSLVKKPRVGTFTSSTRGSDQNDIGFFDIQISNFFQTEQEYLRNSAVLSTKLHDKNGNILEITDFVPRFDSYDREFRPNMLIRIVKPIKGKPRAQIRLRPTFGYGWGTPEKTRGSNHVRYLLSTTTIRLTTNAPISYIVDEVFFEITEPLYLVLMPDESMRSSIEETSNIFLNNTLKYWKKWIQSLTIPFEWQEEVIRACITLKLNHFEESGAIVAAQTTSIPHSPNGHNFDYRYCWLRDSYWVVKVLNELGATDTLANYLKFLSNIVSDLGDVNNDAEKHLQPVYGISLENRLHEREMHRLTGYRGMGPVVLGNRDAESIQHDVYGAVILALTQMFFDKRLDNQGTELLFKQLEELGEKAIKVHDQPDSGPSGPKQLPAVHTFSSAMCWAACDRLEKIASSLKLEERAKYWNENSKMIQTTTLSKSWNSQLNSFTSVWGGNEVDSFLLLLPSIGFISASDKQFLSTLDRIEKKLRKGDYILNYVDDKTANNSATFWFINCLASVGREKEAREMYGTMLKSLNHTSILSESIDPFTKELWGNFPQSIAMVGLIYGANRLSKPWQGAF